MKYIETLDNVLIVLYILKQKHSKDLFSLNQIIKGLGAKLSQNDIYNVGKYLETDGLVNIFSTIGDMFLTITPQGIVYVEKNFEQNIANFTDLSDTISGFNEKAVEEARKPIYEMVDKIKSKFRGKGQETKDAKIDLDIIKSELRKSKPSTGVLVLKINDLEKFNNIRYELFELKNLLDV
jgi:hypothetical protein